MFVGLLRRGQLGQPHTHAGRLSRERWLAEERDAEQGFSAQCTNVAACFVAGLVLLPVTVILYARFYGIDCRPSSLHILSPATIYAATVVCWWGRLVGGGGGGGANSADLSFV